jgi:hypothetical protein
MLGINWKKIDNDVTFHNLVNQLFLSEYGFMYTPGRPRGGADGGWDGCTIEARALRLGSESTRPAMIQAKHTWLAGAKAVSQLKRDLKGRPKKKGELEKARDAGVELLVLVTPAALDVGDVQQLQGVPGADDPKVVVLAQEHLEHLLSRHRWLLRDFFGLSIVSALIPIDRVPDAVHSLGLKPLPWVGHETTMPKVIELVRVQAIVVVVAGGGEGKSRFARELAREMERTFDGLVRYNSKSMTAESIIQNEILDPEREYLIVVDDAERTYERDVRAFVREIASGRKLHLLLTARAGASEVLERELTADGVMPSILELPRVDDKERRHLIASEFGVDDTDAELVDRQCDGNFFIISCLATSRIDAAFRYENVKKYVNYRIREQTKEALVEVGLSAHRDLLPMLASIAGTQHGEEMLREIGRVLSIDGGLVSHLRVLQIAGVLRDVDESCRFEVDMVGDIVLELAMSEAHAGGLVDFVLGTLLPLDEHCVFRNLASAATAPELAERLRRIFNGWENDVRRGDLVAVHKRSECLMYFGGAVPVVCAQFVRAVIDVCEQKPAIIAGTRVLDVLAPLVRRIGMSVDLVPAMLDALDRLSVLQISPVQTHRSAGEVVAVWCNAAELRSFELPIAILGRVEHWLADASLSPPRIAMATSAVSMCLAGALPRERSFPEKYVFGVQCLLPTVEAERVRDIAVTLLVRLIGHGHADTRIAAMQVIADIGSTKGIGDTSSPFHEHAVVETDQCLQAVRAVVAKDSRLRVQVTAWVVVLREWLCSPEQEDIAASILSAIPWTIELRASLAWWFPHESIDSFAGLQARAPREGRWAWWCHEGSRWPTTGDAVPASDIRLAEEVATSFASSDRMVDFFQNIAESAARDVRERWRLPDWLLVLAGSHSDIIEGVLVHPEKARIPADVLSAIESAWLRSAADAPTKVLANVHGEERRLEVGLALQLTFLARIGRVSVSYLVGLAWHDDERVQGVVLAALMFAGTLSSDELGAILGRLVNEGAEERLHDILHQTRYTLHGRLESGGSRRSVREACLGRLGADAASDGELVVLHRLLAWSVRGSVLEYVAAIDEVLGMGFRLDTAALIAPLEMSDGGAQISVGASDVSILLSAWARWLAAGQVDRRYQWRMLRSMGRSAASVNAYIELEMGGDSPNIEHLKELLEAQDFDRCASVWLKLAVRAAVSPLHEYPHILRQFEDAAGLVLEWTRTDDQETDAFGVRSKLLRSLVEETSVPEVQRTLANAIAAVDEQRQRWMSDRQGRRKMRSY